jgi:hypothetical protein
MNRLRLFGMLGLTLLALAGCSRGAKVAPALVDDLARSIGVGAREVELPESQLKALADDVRVQPEAIRAATESAQQQPVWRESLNTVAALDEQTKGKIRSIMVETACDVIKDKVVTYQDFFGNLAENGISNLTQPVQRQLVDATQDLINDLEAALQGGDEARAAVAILCYTTTVVGA